MRHFATGDIDGDGDRDWLGSDSLGELIVWYDGLSEGTLTDPQFVASRELDRATDLQLLDFEGDGDLDVLLQLGETLVWYENLGGGDYAPLSELLDLESEWTETYQLIDLTGDGQLDLTYSILSENFMRVQKERQFGEEVELPFGGTANYVDIDGDSNVDLAIASLNDSRVHFNDGLGNFGEANPLPNVNASELLVADFDGDGDQDLIGSVVGLGTLEQIKLYENTQAGYRVEHIATAPDGRFVFGIYEDMQLADADGDGDQDLFLLGESQSGSGVFGGFSQPIEVFENRMGQFVPAISVTSRDSLGRRSFELADLDSNGLVDIAVVIKPIGDDGIAYFENTFDQTSTISFENRRAVFPGQSLAIGDVDDDGKPDLVVLTQDGNRLGWFRNLSEQGNRVVTPIDIDNLWNAIRSDSNEDRYDWNDDGFVNNVDVDHLVEDVLGTRSGDMDLNGRVDFFDFLSFARNFGEEGLGWGGGDFDGDGTVGFRDFLALAENFLFNIS